MQRSESLAYPKKTSLLGTFSFMLKYKTSRALVATIAFVLFVFIISSPGDMAQNNAQGGGVGMRLRGAMRSNNDAIHWGGAVHPGYFLPQNAVINETSFKFAAVTDLDQLSRVTDSKKMKFKSVLLPGILTRNPADGTYSIKFQETRDLVSQHNEAGRGMELSELTLYDNRLLAFDDRTGSVFEVLTKPGGKESYVVPRFVITEGDGDTDKGMKWEWATVKDGDLYLGSFGKEYTNNDGSIANTNNLWVAVLSPSGDVTRLDWMDKYNLVRHALGADRPGYVIHEAVLWSSHLRKWIFLPRRVSSDPYDENVDERKGSNKLVLVDEYFQSAKVVDIKMNNIDPLHGFSSFAFVPGTGDQHALALRTVEEDCVGGEEDVCKQRTYAMVFDVLTGQVLMDEVQLGLNMKFEGIEFVDIESTGEAMS